MGLTLGLALGCADSELAVTWPGESDLLFLVVEGAGGSGASELTIEGPLRPAEIPRVRLSVSREARVFVVGLSALSGVVIHPRVRDPEAVRLMARSTELSGDTSCDARGWVHGDDAFELPARSAALGARFYELDPEERTFVPSGAPMLKDTLSFWWPLVPCLGGRRLIVGPFREGTGPGRTLAEHRGVQILEDEAVLVWSSSYVRVLPPDEAAPWPELHLGSLALGEPSPGQDWRISAAALLGSSASASGLVAATRVQTSVDLALEGRLFELRIAGGRLEAGPELWRDDAPVRSSLHRIERIEFEPGGGWVAVGEGLVLTGTTASARPERIAVPANFDALRVFSTGDTRRPFLVGGRALLFWLDPARGEAGFEALPLGFEAGDRASMDALDLAPRGDTLILRALFSTPALGRYSTRDSAWSLGPLRTSGTDGVCIDEWSCGRPHARARGRFALPVGWESGATLVGPDQCRMLHAIDDELDCAVSAEVEVDRELFEGSRDQGVLRDAAALGDRAILVGDRARILEARLE